MSEYIVTTEQINWATSHMDEYLPIPARIAGLKPLVRCRDCKHKYGCVHLIEIQQEDGDSDMIRCETSPDCYCSWGERA